MKIYKVIVPSDNTVQTVQNGFENKTSIQRITLSPIPRHHYDDDPAERSKHCSKEETHSDGKADEHREEDEQTYVADKIVRHVGSGPRLRYVV